MKRLTDTKKPKAGKRLTVGVGKKLKPFSAGKKYKDIQRGQLITGGK